jgi:hypothetical protein
MFPARLSLLMLSCTLDSDSVRDHAPTNPAAELLSRETQAAARMLGIEIHLIDVRLMGGTIEQYRTPLATISGSSPAVRLDVVPVRARWCPMVLAQF